MNLARLLARSAILHPERPAVLRGERRLYDYAELADRAARIAAGLRERYRLVPGDRLALFMANTPEYLELLYGAWWAGLAVVPINARLHPQEVAYIVRDAEAALLFVTAELDTPMLAEALCGIGSLRASLVAGAPAYAALLDARPEDRPADVAPDAPAWLFYTSGTTGRPKGVMHSHRNHLAMLNAYLVDVDEVAPDDAIVYAAPMSHGAGLYSAMFVARAARHVIPLSGGFEPVELVGLAERVGRLCFFAAPTMVKRLVAHVEASGADCAGFKTIVYGGGPMYLEDIRHALRVMGGRFVQIYGQGEAPMSITVLPRRALAETSHPRWLERLASVGIPFTLTEVRVADAQGRTLPAGEVGEVLVRGDVVMAGYWRNPGADAQTLRDGWLWTGDMGYLDDQGFLTLRDRSRDVIISGGSNVYPREVEEVLLTHPGVREVAVLGRQDAEWGEAVVAFVVAEPGVRAADLDRTCLARMARFKRPRQYHFVDALPKNHYGKVLKTALRAGNAAGPTRGATG